MASGIAVRLFKAGFRRILMLEREKPLAVRRLVCFSEAVYDGSCRVEDVQARLLSQLSGIEECFQEGFVAVLVDPVWESLPVLRPEVVIDAILAKKNLGTTQNEAPLVIGIGPGFVAGDDVHLVVESMRGHHLGRVISSGSALPDTGIPGEIAGYTSVRILRAPEDGILRTARRIGDTVRAGESVGEVAGKQVVAMIGGIVRGLIRDGVQVSEGMKLGDIDPRGEIAYADLVSDKARAIGGGVLEALLAAGENLTIPDPVKR